MPNSDTFRSIILNRDAEGLIALDSGEKEDFLLTLIYDHLADIPIAEMNEAQKTLYLASRLEDICQADALPSLSEDEEAFLALPEIKKSLERLGAFKAAGLLDEFISLLPVGEIPEWDWFFEPEREDIIKKIDSGICNYPDGPMRDLYVDYISNAENVKQVLMNLK
ncbi:MAG: hypothetical protein K2J77_12850 [Oscillospiraceae bacterium]|nr:hypothetical protein [Oscillospiraceae bacterium]